MKSFNTVLVTTALVAGTFAASAPTLANPVSLATETFSQFAQISSARTLQYKNEDVVTVSGKKSHQTTTVSAKAELVQLDVKGALPTVNFTALESGIGIKSGQTVVATMAFDAFSEGAPTAGSNKTASQLFDGTATYVDVATGKTLLGESFTGAQFTSTLGSNSFVLNGNAANGGVVSYWSDVFTNLGTQNDFSLSGSGTSVPIAWTSAEYSLNYKGGFKGSVSGTFSTTQVPEPGALSVLGLGLIGFAAFRKR